MALAGDLQGHGLLALAGVGWKGGQIQIGEQGQIGVDNGIEHLFKLRIHREGILREAHGVAQALAHLLDPIEPRQDGQQHPKLGALAEVALQIAAHGHVEFLIGAPQLQIRLDGMGVVTLQQGIEEFVQGNRRSRSVAVGEILLGQHLAHGGHPQEFNHLRQGQARQPFTVAAHLKAARGLEIQEGLVLGQALPKLGQVGAGIRLHGLGAELHPGRTLAGGIANAGGEIANDQHRRVARILEGPQFAEQNRMPQVDIGARGVDAELHP